MRARLALVAIVTVAAMVTLGGCTHAEKASAPTLSAATSQGPPLVELHVAAATSLKSALEAAAPTFEAEHNAKIVFDFAASGLLQKQIEQGAPIDVFASASPTQIDALVAQALISAEATVTFASNGIAVIVAPDDPLGITGPNDLLRATRLTTGDPETAPHGTKAREWLQSKGLWAALQPRFVFAQNAAQTMDYVARGEVDAGFTFTSEVWGKDAVKLAYVVPAGEYEPIRYVAAPIVASSQPELSSAWIAYLLSPTGQKHLTDRGFTAAP
ncbi:MAG: molybdate ABC transporter substrate-binding protein [Actinobacteria bacterium]|nr:molybdate ABC transporter substrate-binding protein [Actinomycetota bacterium]MCG2808302.1 molybdate ABC transporter substrate-binding protein [Coriobacteriia bacterium]